MINLLKKLSDNNIYLDIIDEKLKLYFEGDQIDASLLEEIKSNKEALIAYLKTHQITTLKEGGTQVIPLVAQSTNGYVLSSAQRRIWILSQVEANSIAYNMPFQLDLNGAYDIALFKKAIYKVIDRYEILRTVFREDEAGEIKQWVLSVEELGFEIHTLDYSGLKNAVKSVKSYVKKDTRKAFDLVSGPLLRVSFLKLDEAHHVLYFNMHHIIGDGWSMDVLKRDIMQYYGAFKTGAEVQLPELRIQYKDYASWQINQEHEENYQEHRKYWTNKLSGELTRLDLPSDLQRPKLRTYNGEVLGTYVSSTQVNALRAFVQEQGGSLFMGLLAIWNVLLYKYTAQRDLLIGTPVTGRSQQELEHQIGFYVNTLVLRNQLNPGDCFSDFYRSVKDAVLSDFVHQDFPFDRLAEYLSQSTDLSRNALFDVMLVLQNTGDKTAAGGSFLQDINEFTFIGDTVSKFDLEITFSEVEDMLDFKICYNRNIYDRSMVERLMGHFKNLLSALTARPETLISEAAYLSESESDILLNVFNSTSSAYPRDQTVVDLFVAQAARTPDQIALAFEGRELTYRELNSLSSQFAQYLLQLHEINVEDFVGLKLQRGEWMIISILAVLKTGAAYVPIDPDYPEQRIAYITSDCQCKLTIDESVLTDFIENQSDYTGELPDREVTAENLAYVMYTSGSTGRPKGVMIEHRSIVRLVQSSNYYKFSSSSVLLATGALSFDATTFEFWGTLLNGGRLELCPFSTLLDSNLLAKQIKTRGVNVMWFTSGWLSQLVDHEIDLFSSLRTVITGGDKLSPPHIKKLRENYPALEIINGYGPTENTTFSLTYNIEEVDGDIPVGYPISNSTAYLFDEFNQLVPIGAVGELYLGGDGLSRGYWNQPELTAERFIEHPYITGERLYKTGDLGKWNPDGSIAFMGRKDNQVKIRGYRIEPGEIEQAILSLDYIRQAVVEIKEISGNKEIVAYITVNGVIDKKEIKRALSKELPAHMLPGYYVELDVIPLNANGKVDRNTLPEITEDDAIQEAFFAVKNEQERVLLSVWTDVLKRNKISTKDDFYNLGGDSIKSIQVVSRLKQMGYRLKVEDILRTSVLEELAELMILNDQVIDQSTVTGDVGLTPIQQWFFESQNIINPHHYNQSVLLKSKTEIDGTILDTCLAALVVHHDALRMRFTQTELGWTQTHGDVDGQHYELLFHDLSAVEQALEMMSVIGQRIQESIDLEKGPLVKVCHFRLSDGDRVAIIVHHLVVDGVSWRILLEDLSALYAAGLEGAKTVTALPLKTNSFQSWSQELDAYVLSEKMASERTYWNSVCSQNLQAFPTDLIEQTELSSKVIQSSSFSLDQAVTELLQTKVHGVYNTEINDILLTGLGLAVREVFNITQFNLKMEGHGREELLGQADVTRTVGWFTSIFPFISDLTGAENEIDALIMVKENLRRIPNKGVGYGILKYLDTDFKHEMQPGIVFNYLGDFGTHVGNTDEALFEYSNEGIGTDISLQNGNDAIMEISGMMVSGQLHMTIRYDQLTFRKETIDRLADVFQQQLIKLIVTINESEENYLTPSDLTFKGLTIEELSLINQDNNVEDIYKLSPLQQGMYFHWLSAAGSSVYFEQISYRPGKLIFSVADIKTAFEQLVARHAVLRTCFSTDFSGIPLQIVRKSVDVAFSFEKLTDDLSTVEIESRLREIKQLDKASGFDLNGHSQIRLKIVDLGNGEAEFIWSFHHILMDGWCMGILIRDFYTLLNSIGNHIIAELPVPVAYSKYIQWIDQVDSSQTVNYWNAYLNGYANQLELPFTVKNWDRQDYKHDVKRFEVSRDVFEKIAALCVEIGITQNVFMQTAWGYLLSRYNRVDDIVFGAVVSGRPSELKGVEDMVGLFINTIPVRIKYAAEVCPKELLKTVHQDAISGNAHHFLSLSEIQAQSEPGRDLFNHIMVFENYPLEDQIGKHKADDQKPVVIKQVEVFERTNYDFNIVIAPVPTGLTVEFRYNSARYDATVLESLKTHFIQVLEEFSNAPEQVFSEHTYLNKNEYHKVLNIFNDTSVTYPDKTILDYFEAQVKQNPGHVAVVFESKSLTFSELDKLSNRLSHYLRKTYKVGRNDLVGLRLHRSEWMLVAILGILKSGGAYVPIDPEYPQERLSFIQNDSAYKVCLDQEALNRFNMVVSDYPATSLKHHSNGGDAAYAIYTSGSTGIPKGVLNHHLGLSNRLVWMRDYLNVTTRDVILQKTPYTFDVSVWELLLPVVAGCTLVFAKPEGHKDPAYLQQVIKANGITITHFVPSMLGVFLIDVEEESCASLSHVVCSGEALPGYLVNTFKEKLSGCKIHNLYGPTEAAIDVTAIDLTNIDVDVVGVSIGYPISNTKIYITDDELNLQGVGIVGELLIGGVQVSSGYLNRAALNEASFIDNPFDDGRLYRTGDLARWSSDGSIEYIGRKDHQVKIRGHRIELGEIEYQLLLKAGIKEAVVIAKENLFGTRELVAYLVSDHTIQISALRNYLSDRLPEYMVPGHYVQLDNIPLTQSGKIDRKALPDPENAGIDNGEVYIAPRTHEEVILIDILKDVLKRAQISVYDNFFNLGGDSIKSIQVVARIKQKGYSLRVEQILSNPRVEDLASCIIENKIVVNQAAVKGTTALNPVQLRFFNHPVIQNLNHYNQSVVIRSRVEIDTEMLSLCISQLVAHHDALRIVFYEDEGNWIPYHQEVNEKPFPVLFYDLTGEADEVKKMEEIGNAVQSGLKLEGPLFNVVQFRAKDGDYVALIVHHLLIDGVSWRILFDDLSSLFSQYGKGTEGRLPLKTDSFQHWTKMMTDYAERGLLAEEQSYWETICDQKAVDLPYRQGAKNKLIRYDHVNSFTLSSTLTDLLLTQVHHAYNTEINDILLTGLGLSLNQVFGEGKFVLKMEGHGREELLKDIDVSRTIGWFTSIYPFILDISKQNSAIGNLVQVKESLRQIPNKGIGYGMLRYLTSDFNRDFEAAIEFNYLGDFGKNAGENGAEHILEYTSRNIGAEVDANTGVDTPLSVTGMLVGGQLTMSVNYPADLFEPELIKVLCQTYQEQLEGLIEVLSAVKVNELTPADLTYKGLSIAELAEINPKQDIQDIYPLSPLQQGLYFHWLSAPESPAYFYQIAYRVKSEHLIIDDIAQAYQQLIDRYDILRTGFINDFGGVPLQIVRKGVKGDFSYRKIAQKASLDAVIDEEKTNDRKKGFDFSSATQMRLTVLDLDNGTYEFIWSYHHILMDGWCISILINDFSQLLAAIQHGSDAALGVPVPYSSYFKWLHKLDRNQSKNYWRNYLEGYDTKAEIPFAVKTWDKVSYQDAVERLEVNGSLHQQLKTFCAESGITQNTLVQAVWGYLLSIYNNTNDVVFGAVVSGRPAELKGVEQMVGLFSNTIPVRVNYTKDMTAEALLARVQQGSISGHPHHYLNLADVGSQSELNNNLFDHIIVFENFLVQDRINNKEKEAAEMTVESVAVFDRTNYDFNITVLPEQDKLLLEFRHNGAKYKAEKIQQLAGHFNQILTQFITTSEAALGTISCLSVTEREELLETFNATSVNYKTEETVLDLFKAQVIRTPLADALVFDGKVVNYQDLDLLSSRLAYALKKEYNIGQEDIVAIKLDRSDWTMVAILGVLKAGAAYVPIDTNIPAAREKYILEDSSAKLIITDTQYLFDFSSYDGQVFAIDVEFEPDQYPVTEVNEIGSVNHLAYVIYTSGSTGNPKGVLIEHQSLYNYLNWANQHYLGGELKNTDFGLFTSLSFDLTVTSLFLPLISGGTLKVFNSSEDVSKDLRDYIESNISCIKLTPAHIGLLGELDLVSSNLEIAIVGGDALHKNHIHILKALNPDIRIFNEYGPTEATVGCVVAEVGADVNEVVIGVPIANTAIYIIGENGGLQPCEIAGELCIGGAGLARGYLNRSDLTAEKFIDHPFKSGARLYRTGDLAKWLPDGNLDYLGRMDNQIKIRGYRIELGEIEKQINAKTDIVEAVVLVKALNSADKELVCYFVSSVDQNTKELRKYISERLPEYMIPKYFVQLEQMPLTVNGKIDKKSLPNPLGLELSTGEAYVMPRNEKEQQLVEIVARLTGRKNEEIGINDNFFDLGLNSLELMRFENVISKELGVKVKLTMLFTYPNVKSLVEHIFYQTDAIVTHVEETFEEVDEIIDLID